MGLAAAVESMSRSGWALMKGEEPFMPRELRYGVLGVCVGSGQGVALVLENVRAAA